MRRSLTSIERICAELRQGVGKSRDTLSYVSRFSVMTAIVFINN